MADTAKVLQLLEEEAIWDQTATKALVIVANERGIRDAVEFESVSALGFPFSISPTFQERNTRVPTRRKPCVVWKWRPTPAPNVARI